MPEWRRRTRDRRPFAAGSSNNSRAHRSSCSPASRPSTPTCWRSSNGASEQLHEIDDHAERGDPGGDVICMPDTRLAPVHQRLEADKGREDHGLIESRVEAAVQAWADGDMSWERHLSYRFINLSDAQPNETRPLPGRDGREPLPILHSWCESLRIPQRT